MPKRSLLLAALASTAIFMPAAAQASACVGNCGTFLAGSGDAGDVGLPTGSTSYQYVTTASFGGLSSVLGGGTFPGETGDETNGSTFTTASFSAAAGQKLSFLFNYVTSDGAGFADYAWSALTGSSGGAIALLTARTFPSGPASPAIGLPPMGATLTPDPLSMQSGLSNWFALGDSSGTCFDPGCGNTGWVLAEYVITEADTYTLSFGVTNWGDDMLDSGLAFANIQLNGAGGISTVPEPAQWALMIVGFGLAGASLRRRRMVTVHN